MADATQINLTQDALLEMHQTLATLANKHASVSYVVLGVLTLVLMLAGLGGWLALKAYDNALAKAQVTEQKYSEAQKTLTALLATDAQERAAMQAQQATLEAQILKRDRMPLPAPIASALQPNATAETAANALGSVFTLSPYPLATSEGKVALTVPNAQELITDGVDLSRLRLDFKDTQILYGLEQQKSGSLTKDLTQCTTTLTDAQKSLTAYKKLAVRSKFRKFLDGATKVGIFATGAFVGHKF